MTTPLPIPLGPIARDPARRGPSPSEADLRALLHHALRGVDLGGYDEQIVAWLTGWDASTVTVVASWLERARLADRAEAVALVGADLGGAEREWQAMPADERGSHLHEDAYQDGIRAALAVLAGERPPRDGSVWG